MILVALRGDENSAPKQAQALAERFARDRQGVRVQAGGSALVYEQVNQQTERDLVRMEFIAIPMSFIVLVWVFGGLLAAALPVAVGGLAILGSLAVLRAIASVTNVSIFALNVTVALGFALAIDYTLLIISRYPRRVGRWQQPRRGFGDNGDHGGPHRAVFGDFSGPGALRDGAVPDVFPQILRLRRNRRGGVRRVGCGGGSPGCYCADRESP